MRLSLLASFLGLAFAGACTTDTGTAAQSIACYDTANGVVCKQATGSKESVDVDGDGRRDAYVCGDTTSASDSVSDSNGDDATSGGDDDGPGDDDDGTDDGATLAMSDSDDADSDSTSNADCASHDSASDDPSASDSTVDSADSAGDDSVSDGDDDGTADGDDCDCVPPPPGTPA